MFWLVSSPLQLPPPPVITKVTNPVPTGARQGHQRPSHWALGREYALWTALAPARELLQLEDRPSSARRARSPREAGNPDLCDIFPFLNFTSHSQDTGWTMVSNPKSTCPPTDSCQDRVHRTERGQRGEATHSTGVLDSTGAWPLGLCNPHAMMRGEQFPAAGPCCLHLWVSTSFHHFVS